MVLPLRTHNAAAASTTHQQKENGGVSFYETTEVKRPSPHEHHGPIPLTPHPKKKQRLTNSGDSVPMEPPRATEYAPPNDDMQYSGAATAMEDHNAVLDKENHDQNGMVETENPNGDKKNMMENAANDATTEEETPEEEEDPDWTLLAQHDPARTDIPIFLEARAQKLEAEKRFGAALDECHAAINQAKDTLLDIAVQVYQTQHEKMEMLENDIKHNLVCNHEARAVMQQRLKESAEEAQGLFAQLMMRVSQPFLAAAAQLGNGQVEK